MFNRRQREREYFQALAAMQEMLETREKLMTLTMELAMSMALIDGTIDKSEIKEVKKWAESKTYYFDGERRVQNQELMDVYNAALETALDDVEKGKVTTSNIIKEINRLGDRGTKYDAIELAYKVLSADQKFDKEESRLIDIIAEDFDLDPQKIDLIRDAHLLTVEVDAATSSEILDIEDGWSKSQKEDYLKKEFIKWNNRLSALSNQNEKENAQKVLNLIATEMSSLETPAAPKKPAPKKKAQKEKDNKKLNRKKADLKK